MAHAYRSLYFHLIFRVAGCRILPADVRDVHAYIQKVMVGKGCKSITIGGIEDHVHILAEFPLDKIGEVVNVVKTSTSKLLKRRAPDVYGDFSWQRGYALFSVSYSLVDAVVWYILNQRKHHLKVSYQSEFEKYLDVHDLEYHPEWE